MRTVTPPSPIRVKISAGAPSGARPNGSRLMRVAASAVMEAPIAVVARRTTDLRDRVMGALLVEGAPSLLESPRVGHGRGRPSGCALPQVGYGLEPEDEDA